MAKMLFSPFMLVSAVLVFAMFSLALEAASSSPLFHPPPVISLNFSQHTLNTYSTGFGAIMPECDRRLDLLDLTSAVSAHSSLQAYPQILSGPTVSVGLRGGNWDLPNPNYFVRRRWTNSITNCLVMYLTKY